LNLLQPVISIIIPIISLVTSVVTLLLTQFNGPDITLLNQPTFQISDKQFAQSNPDYTPIHFRSDPVTMIFSNYGGKAGTILDLQLEFHPDKALAEFVDKRYQRHQQQLIDEPLILPDGENEPIEFNTSLRMIDWKKAALVDVLNPTMRISQILEQASEVGQSKYLQFCDVLEKANSLGTVACQVTLTKGRFRTRVVQEHLFENVEVENRLETLVPALRKFVNKWDSLYYTDSQLTHDLRRGVGDVVRENQTNLPILKKLVTEETLNNSQLRTDAWKNLTNPNLSVNDRILRWFLIDSEPKLREQVSTLYHDIEEYNSQINIMLTLGEFRQDSHYENINARRTELIRQIKSVSERLLALGPKME
jgi:hypothetical protein